MGAPSSFSVYGLEKNTRAWAMRRRTGLERGPYRLWAGWVISTPVYRSRWPTIFLKGTWGKEVEATQQEIRRGRGATPQWLSPSFIFSLLCLLEGFLPERQLFHGLGTVGREEAHDTWPLVLMKAILIHRQDLLAGNRITCKQSFQTQEKGSGRVGNGFYVYHTIITGEVLTED